MQIDVKHDLHRAVTFYQALSMKHGDMQKAFARAMNRVADQASTQAARQIAQTYSFKYGDVRRSFKVVKAGPTSLEVKIMSTGRRIPLANLSARQTARGVSIRIKQNRKVIRNVFIATMKSGHRGVFEREGRKRLPIRELFTIAVPEAFASKDVIAAVERTVRTLLPDRVRHELEYIASRARR